MKPLITKTSKVRTIEEKRARAIALLEAFEILHNYFMTTTDIAVMDILEKAQKDIISSI